MSSLFTRHSTKAMTMSRADGVVLAIVAASVLAVVAGFTTMAATRPARQATVTDTDKQVPKDELSEVSTCDSDQTPLLSSEIFPPEKEHCADPEHGSVQLTDSMTATDEATESERDVGNEKTFSKETAAVGGSVASDETDESSKEAVSPPEKAKLRTKFRVLLQGAPSGSPKNSKLRMKLRALMPRKKTKEILDR